MGTVVLWGKVVSGIGQGTAFTQLPWVQTQFTAKLGINAHPGTLNLRLEDPVALAAWRRLRDSPGIRIEPVSREYCEARGFPAVAVTERAAANLRSVEEALNAGGQRAAIIFPDVPGYPEDQVELIAAVNLREALRLRDGDVVWVYVEVERACE